jgi:hypothetical protein
MYSNLIAPKAKKTISAKISKVVKYGSTHNYFKKTLDFNFKIKIKVFRVHFSEYKYYAVQILSVVTKCATMLFKKSKLLLKHSDISQT